MYKSVVINVIQYRFLKHHWSLKIHIMLFFLFVSNLVFGVLEAAPGRTWVWMGHCWVTAGRTTPTRIWSTVYSCGDKWDHSGKEDIVYMQCNLHTAGVLRLGCTLGATRVLIKCRCPASVYVHLWYSVEYGAFWHKMFLKLLWWFLMYSQSEGALFRIVDTGDNCGPFFLNNSKMKNT